MSAYKIKLDRQAIGRVLKGAEVRAHLHTVADPIASDVVRNPAVTRAGASVYTRDYETDRAVVAVTIDSAAGAGLEARYRLLRGAAEARGVKVDAE